jgi:Relaxase/Mobilisation nuclease domain
MILKGSQRANGADLAIHLMNSFDNERIEIAEVYGAVADDLLGAFAEFEAVSLGTKAREYLYSLSISPSAPLTREQYFEAIGVIENRLGLTGQPRAVVFHVKDGREHCHVVWSRTDVDKMRAVHMAHDHRKLMDLACELARKYGLELPPGLEAWEKRQKLEKEKLEPTLGEKAQAEETGIPPEQRRAEITAAYEQSDTGEAFRSVLEQKGYVLARGDKRGLVVVDKFGGVHSLTRYIKGHTAKEIKAKLAALSPEQLPSADQAKEIMRQRAQALNEREREQQQDEQRDLSAEALAKAERLAEFRRQKENGLAGKQAVRRLEIQQAEQQLFTRQQSERLALHAAQMSESRGFLFRVRSTVADLIRRMPGLRSVLSHIQKMTHLDPKERHRLENDALARRHAREKREIERRRRALARLETRERHSLEKAVMRQQRLQEVARLEAAQAAARIESRNWLEGDLQQEFDTAAGFDRYVEEAGDEGLTPDWREMDLQQEFHFAAGFDHDDEDSGDGDDGPAPDRNEDSHGNDKGPGFRPRRRKAYGYR